MFLEKRARSLALFQNFIIRDIEIRNAAFDTPQHLIKFNAGL